ncbi:hypothetical protein LT493_44180 [Streptomyces tricolor]|nr:hypothetical protein [Streptomyces tricolor]
MIADDDALGWDGSAAADAYRDRDDAALAEQLIFPAVLRRLSGRSGPGRLAHGHRVRHRCGRGAGSQGPAVDGPGA